MMGVNLGRDGSGEGVCATVGVVIPCFRVTRHILEVITGIPSWVSRIYVVDDRCPDGSGELVEKRCHDPRVTVLFNSENLGVGGADERDS